MNNGYNSNTESLAFKKVNEPRVLETILNAKNDWSVEIKTRVAKMESASISLIHCPTNSFIEKKNINNNYTNNNWCTLIYGCNS